MSKIKVQHAAGAGTRLCGHHRGRRRAVMKFPLFHDLPQHDTTNLIRP